MAFDYSQYAVTDEEFNKPEPKKFDYSAYAVSDEEFNKPEPKKFDYSSYAVSDEEFNKDSNFSLLEKLGAKKPKDFKPKDTSLDYLKAFAGGAVGTVDSLGAMFKSLGDDGEVFGNKLLANMTSSAGDAIKSVTTPVLDSLQVENPTLATDVASGFGSAATFFIPGLGAAKGAQLLKLTPKVGVMLGTGTSAIIESGVESGGVYDRLIEKGMDAKEAGDRATASFWANIPVNAVLDKWMFKKMPGGKVITSMLKGSSKEATQEGIQQIISNVAAEDPAFEGVGRSALVGGIVGGTIGGVKTKLDNATEEDLTPPQQEDLTPPQQEEVVEDVAPEVEKENTVPLTEKQPINKIAQDIIDLADDKKTKVKAFGKKYFTKEKGLPSDLFKANEKRLGQISSAAINLKFKLADFNKAKKIYKEQTKQDITPDQSLKLDQALKNKEAMAELESDAELNQFYEPLQNMRKEIDVLSRKMIDEGLAQGDLEATIDKNLGIYINRAYKIHTDPKWATEVRGNKEVWNKAVSWMRSETKDQNLTDSQVEGRLSSILEEHQSSLGEFYNNKKTGSKSLGILKRRKVLPKEMLDLLGEITDPEINFANTIGKMSNLLANHQFLNEVKAAGEGKFLFQDPDVIEGIDFTTPIDKSKSYSPLNDMYTTKEIAESLQSDTVNNGTALTLYLKGMGYTKWAKTVASPTTQIRNLTSNIAFAVANGHFDVNKMRNAFKTIKTKLANSSDSEGRNYLLKLTQLGLVDQSGDIGVAKEMVKEPESKTGKIIYKGLDKLSDVYQASDTVWKIYAFENEVERQQKARPEMSKSEIEELSAEIIKNTYPTYSRVGEGIKKLGKSPLVGTFVNFSAETIRTSYNTLKLAKEELQDPKTKYIGAKRLAGFSSMLMMTKYAIPLVGRLLSGITKDDEEDIRKFIPEWSINSPLLTVGFDKDKKRFSYVDLGTQMPHAYLMKPFIAFMRGDQDLDDRFIGAFSEMVLKPFLSEEMLTSALLDISRNRTKEGRPIYSEMDTGLSKILKTTSHISKVFDPGVLSSTKKLFRKKDGDPGYYGNINTFKGEVGSMLTGVRVSTYDIPKSLQFKSDQFKQKKRESYKAGGFGDTESKMASMQRSYEWMQDHVDAAQRLGVKNGQIRRLLKEEKVSGDDARSFIRGNHTKQLRKIRKRMGKKHAN